MKHAKRLPTRREREAFFHRHHFARILNNRTSLQISWGLIIDSENPVYPLEDDFHEFDPGVLIVGIEGVPVAYKRMTKRPVVNMQTWQPLPNWQADIFALLAYPHLDGEY